MKSRIKELEAGHHFTESHPKSFQTQDPPSKDPDQKTTGKKIGDELFEIDSLCEKAVNNYASKEEKITLFMTLFKGRSDVYAKRWKNKKGQS